MAPFLERQGLPVPERGRRLRKDFTYPQLTYPRYLSRGIPPDTMADELLSTYQVQATVYRCVRALATNLAKLPPKVFREISETEREDVSMRPEFDVLVRRPNEFMPMSRFLEMTAGYLNLAGEAPWALERNKGNRAIKAIYPLRPDKIRPVPDPKIMIAGYVYEHEGRKYTLDRDEVLFLHYFNPTSDFRGLSPMRAAQLDIELDLRAMAANRSMFLHGAKPGGILTADFKQDEDMWERFKQGWREEYAGAINQGETIFLEGDVKYERIGLTNEDMQYLEGRQWTADQVGEVYGVPPILRMQFKEASVLANAEVQLRLFWDETMRPFTSMIASYVTMLLLPSLSNTPNLTFEYDMSGVSALQPDRVKQAMIAERVFKTGGISPNQVAQIVYSLPADPNPAMDLHYIPIGMQAIGSPPSEERDYVEIMAEVIDDTVRRLENKNEIEMTKDALLLIEGQLDKQGDMELAIKGRASLDRILARRIPAMTRKVRALFAGQMKEILANLKTERVFWKKQFDVQAVNFDLDEWIARFEEEGKPEIALALGQAANDLADSVGGTFDISGDVRSANFINYQSRHYAEMVCNTTYGRVDTILRGALSSGLSIGETSALITEYFADNAAYRAERVARTEMVRASNAGRMHSMMANEWPFNMWVSQRDTRVREEHISLDGEVVRVGDSFSNGLDYPQEVMCRCYTIPQRSGPE